MRVRFSRPERPEAAREDLLRLRHAPAQRPGRAGWRWYALLAALGLPVAWLAWQGLVAVACAAA